MARHIARSAFTVAIAATLTLGFAGCNALVVGGDSDDSTDVDTTTTDDGGTTDTGESTGEDVSITDIQVGDCLVDAEDGEVISTITVVPCEELHDTEVYYIFDMPESDYPGDDGIDATIDETCGAEFETFAGIAYADSTDLDYWAYSPTEEGWNAGDREITCVIWDLNGQIDGSLAGAAR